jgi:hypothetical protein
MDRYARWWMFSRREQMFVVTRNQLLHIPFLAPFRGCGWGYAELRHDGVLRSSPCPSSRNEIRLDEKDRDKCPPAGPQGGRAPFARLQVYAAWCPRVFCNVGLQACLAMDIEPQEFCTALEYYEPAPLGMLPSTSTEDIQEATT